MPSVAVLSVGVSIARANAERAAGKPLADLPLEARARAVFREVRGACFMTPDEESLFQVGLAVLLLPDVTPEGGADRARLDASVLALKTLSAMMSGVPVDVEAVLPREGEPQPPPLLSWFREEALDAAGRPG